MKAELFRELVERTPPSLLATAAWQPDLTVLIEGLNSRRLEDFGFSPRDISWVRAALHIGNDDLDPAHRIVQEACDVDGYLLHAILHRREGDYENARYWLLRTGEHPLYGRMYREVTDVWPGALEWKRWQPERFVDMVREADMMGHLYAEAVLVQAVEWRLVLRYLLGEVQA